MVPWSTQPSKADLYLQQWMHDFCAPAHAAQYSLRYRKPAAICNSDCFVTRIYCDNFKTVDMLSTTHPATTKWQAALLQWMPASLCLILGLPLLVYLLAAFSARMLIPLTAANVLIISYFAAATLSLTNSITAELNREWGWLEKMLFLNSYGIWTMAGTFLLINAVPLWRTLEAAFYNHSAEAIPSPSDLSRAATLNELRDAAAAYRNRSQKLHAAADALRNESHDLHSGPSYSVGHSTTTSTTTKGV
jgi:hypothetical protein